VTETPSLDRNGRGLGRADGRRDWFGATRDPTLRLMRRWSVALVLLLAIGGLALAFALPSGHVPDCPPPSTGLRCIYHTDVRPWLRFLVAAAGVLPALILIGSGLGPNRKFASAILIAGTAVAVGLFLITGPIPASPGTVDCVAYPRCYVVGHPYGGPAFLVFLITAAVGFWLWPYDLWDERPKRSHLSHPAA
jgi:hypothetical protein